MIPCPKCRRHLRDGEATCPFCASSLPMGVLKVTAILLTPIVLAACYGPPNGPNDVDGGAGTAGATGSGGTGGRAADAGSADSGSADGG